MVGRNPCAAGRTAGRRACSGAPRSGRRRRPIGSRPWPQPEASTNSETGPRHRPPTWTANGPTSAQRRRGDRRESECSSAYLTKDLAGAVDDLPGAIDLSKLVALPNPCRRTCPWQRLLSVYINDHTAAGVLVNECCARVRYSSKCQGTIVFNDLQRSSPCPPVVDLFGDQPQGLAIENLTEVAGIKVQQRVAVHLEGSVVGVFDLSLQR